MTGPAQPTWDAKSTTWDMEEGQPFETEGGDPLELEADDGKNQ